MKIAELEEKINLLNIVAANHVIKKEGKTYRVNPCPVCGGQDHFTVYPETNSFSSFSGCCTGGSVYKYLVEVEKMNEEAAYEELVDLAGETISDRTHSVQGSERAKKKEKGANSHQTTKPEGEAPLPDYTDQVVKLYQKQTEQDREYFRKRGIPDDLIEKYKLCISHSRDGKRALLPVWSNGKVVYYTARALDGQEPRYRAAKGTAQFFNLDYIRQKADGEPIFVAESIFDALSIEAAGYRAIGLGGAQRVKKLLKAIQEAPDPQFMIFLSALDNDDAGKKAADELGFQRLQIPEQYKDVNEWRMNDPNFNEAIKEQVSALIFPKTRPDAVSSYLENGFVEEIKKNKSHKTRTTGFKNLDDKLNALFPGLYVLGGASSLGKTTFVHQMGDQLAEQGEHVIYFSLEQSRLELVSKSLARITAKQNYTQAVPSISIRSGYVPQQVLEAAKSYQEAASRINIIEGNFHTTVDTIREYIKRYILFNRVKPVVIVDYLQIIQADPRLSDKAKVDYNITELKRMTRDFDIPLIALSSMNRGSYLAPVDFESFKESGSIEYSADVVWGLQLQAVSDELFEDDKSNTKKREVLRAAKAADPRKIQLVCLKNRNGKSFFSCNFTYYAQYDLFVADPDFE